MALGKRLINTGGVAACTTDSTDPFGDSSGVALYSLDYDASTAPDGTDYSGSPSNVTFGVGGQINYGARFNGSSSKIALPNVINFSTGEHTISAWINTTSTSVTRFISNLYTGTVPDGSIDFVWIPASNSISVDFSIGGSNYTNTITGISTGQWYHIAATFVNNGTCTAYLNGSSVDTVIAPSFTATAYQPLNLGYYERGNNYWSGSIDQVRIFSKALNSTEVDTIYAETACVYTATTTDNDYPTTNLAYYKLDNSAEDEKGSYDGTETNVEYRFGRFGQAAVFNGSSSKIVIPASTSIAQQNNYTFSAWFKTDTLGVMQTIYAFNSPSTYQSAIFIHSNGTNNIRIFSAGSNYYSSDNIYTNNQWYHIAVTKSSTNGIVAYLDGVEIINEPTATANNLQPAAGDNRIGGYKTASESLWFDGSIDQVRIYSTALTSSQVTELYNEKPETDTSNFKTVLYEGTGATQFISNVGMDLETNGGLIWLKGRDSARDHRLFDSVRGATKGLYSNLTNAEFTESGVDSFEDNGFFLGSAAGVNANNESFVGWVFKGGGEAVPNTNGTGITSSVSANQDAGFSIVSYTGSGNASHTVGHGLDNKPELIILKRTSSAMSWFITSSQLGNNEYLTFTTGAKTTDAGSSGVPSSVNNNNDTTFGFRSGSSSVDNVNQSGGTFIAYCFHSVSEYSKIGTYEGLGTSTVTVSDVGFKPSFIMIKNVDAIANWNMYDVRRSTVVDRANKILYPNLNNSEPSATNYYFDMNDSGFVVSATNHEQHNFAGRTYLYMAFK